MKIHGVLIFILLAFLAVSCAGGYQSEIDSSHVKSDSSISDTCMVEVDRYVNGVIASKGMVCNGEKDGYWQAFYSDGSLKWEGRFRRGFRILPDLDSLPKNCTFVFDQGTSFAVGQSIQFRVVALPLGPNDLIISINSGKFVEPDDPDNFDYKVIPTAPGEFCIYADYRHRSNYPICKKCFSIEP